MFKVIKNKKYNTETAKCMAADEYGNPGDFAHWREALYQKATGEFFLHGSGGPMTIYSEEIGPNERCGGEKIIPLSIDEAKVWAEKHLDGDDYEAIFGVVDDPEEKGAKKTVSIRLTDASARKVKNLASEKKMNVSEYIEMLIDQQ
jgi:predicted DNA binding CopG/RHH family protein